MDQLNKIIQASINGDQASQRKLYEQHRTQWYMTSLRYGKNKTQADDIFQEGLIQIFKDLHQFDHNKALFKTWSTRVLINAALKYLKKYNWIDTMSDFENSYHLEDQNETVYDKIATKELTQIIQQLPLGYRMVFNMYVIEGYSHKEIAEQLEITEGTSKSQLSKARRELRNVLELQLIHKSHE